MSINPLNRAPQLFLKRSSRPGYAAYIELYCNDDSIRVCSGVRSISEGIDPVLKLTPSLSKNSAKIPCVPLLDSSEQEADIDASSDALPLFLTPV